MIDFSKFINYLKYEKRVSEHTVTAYQNDLSHFFTFVDEKLQISNLQDINSNDIRTWIISLLEDDSLQPRSVKRKISALRAFYRYELKIKEIQKSPVTIVQVPKTANKLPQYVDKKDMERLFSD